MPVVTTYGMSETQRRLRLRRPAADGVVLEVGRAGAAAAARPSRRGTATARPCVDADGLFTTGDVGALVDGRLVVHGRADDLVVTGGEKVAPAAVEAALAEQDDVLEVAVVGLPDAEWGQRVVAYVVGTVTLEQARAHVAERLGRAAAPRELRRLEALPLLPDGKVDRLALRAVTCARSAPRRSSRCDARERPRCGP